MRKRLLTIIFAVATLHGNAQNVAGNFLPRANDEVTLQQTAYDSKNAASYFDALFYRPVRDADWDLARKAFGEATDSRFGSKQSLWGLATGTLFGVLAVDKFISVPRSALYGVIR